MSPLATVFYCQCATGLTGEWLCHITSGKQPLGVVTVTVCTHVNLTKTVYSCLQSSECGRSAENREWRSG